MNIILATIFLILSLPQFAQAQVGFGNTVSCGGGSGGGGLAVVGPNDGTTGTTTNKLVKFTTASPSTAIVTGTSDTTNILGVCVSGCGTTGSATIAVLGVVSCVFDGATTAGHHVINSPTTGGGDCEDSGSTAKPTASQDLGFVLSTNASAGTYQYLAIPPP